MKKFTPSFGAKAMGCSVRAILAFRGHAGKLAAKRALRSSLLAAVLLLLVQLGSAQDFMMQGWYWDYPKPNCNSYNGPSIASDMAARAAEQSAAGFTMMWLPPLAKASFGDCSNGYDPQDLYDYGQVTGQTGLGTGAEVEAWIAALTTNNIYPVADVVYNHRDGGQWEDNPTVRDYVINYPNGGGCGGFPATPYPVNGKMRYALPLGADSGNGAGDYYFKFASASGNTGFNGRPYKLFFRTKNTGFDPNPINEVEPNGGGDCFEPLNQVFLGRDIFATQEVGMGCNTDEFYLQLNVGDFDPSGDLLEIYIEEVGGGGTGIDQRIYGIWMQQRLMDIVGELRVQTRTDFTALPSGQGAMTYRHFKPNGITPTCLTGDLDFPFFFFDVEQAYDGSAGGESTRKVYDDWNKWLWDTVGIRGFRMDAVKHFPASFVGELLNDLHAAGIDPPLVVGEHFTSDANVLKGWVDGVYAAMTPGASSAIQVRAFDFELRQALKNACDDGLYDVRNIFTQGMVDRAGMSGLNVVTFANNHDYRTVGEHILNRQMLAYAYILTNNRIGLPSVFHPDYYGIDIYGPGNPLDEQKDAIDELMQIHKAYITGANFVDYLNRFGTPYGSAYQQSGPFDHLLYQLQGGVGGKDVIVVINFENQPLRFNHTINTANAPLGTKFTLVSGSSNFPEPLVENNPFNGLPNSLYFDIPAYSYAVYVQGEPFPVDCAGVINGPAVPGTACDDGNPFTGNDTWDNDCNCVGLPLDCNGDIVGPVSLAKWTFEASVPVTAGPHVPEEGAFAATSEASASHASASVTYSNPVGNGSMESFSSNNWATGDYYQFKFPTTGFAEVTVSWDQTRSGTGPATFQLQWSANGAAFNAVGDYTVGAVSWSSTTFNPASSFSYALPAAAGKLPMVWVRLVSLETAASGGTNRVDNFAAAGGNSALPGTPCDDGNPCTINDTYDDDCNCVGTLQIASSTTTETVCNSYTWDVNGQTYTISGTYIEIADCRVDTLILNVEDAEPPTITCPTAQTLILDGNCSASLPDYTSLAVAEDNCGVESVTQSPVAGTVVSGTGDMTVTLTATDSSSLTVVCTFPVAKVDDTPPAVVCLNTTIFLNPSGEYTLTDADVLDFDASSDNCSAITVTQISPSDFDCGDLMQTFDVLVTAQDDSGNSSQCIASITVFEGKALPQPWAGLGIGDQGTGSTYEYSPCSQPPIYIIETGAANNSQTADNLAAIAQTLCGDFSIEVKIEAVTSNGWAGLMVRESAAPGSKMIGMYSNLGSVLRWESRSMTNAAKTINLLQRPFPFWLRLVRQGNLFIGYYSTNGINYSIANIQMLPLNSCLEASLSAFTYLPGEVAMAVFSNVSVSSSSVSVVELPSEWSLSADNSAEAMSIRLFPNPARNSVTLDLNANAELLADGKTIFRLRNEQGQLLEERHFDGQSMLLEWDISKLAAGSYFIELHRRAETPQAFRFIKVD